MKELWWTILAIAGWVALGAATRLIMMIPDALDKLEDWLDQR